MPPRIILHADMDCFYAAVEIHDHPGLAGKPVVVGADPKGGIEPGGSLHLLIRSQGLWHPIRDAHIAGIPALPGRRLHPPRYCPIRSGIGRDHGDSPVVRVPVPAGEYR